MMLRVLLPPHQPPPPLTPPPSAVFLARPFLQSHSYLRKQPGSTLSTGPVSWSPHIAKWSPRVDPLAPTHSLPFTTFRLYKDWLIPFFFPCCLCNEKLSTRSLIKFYAYPTPIPNTHAKKKRGGRRKAGTHLAKGTLVNKKVTHHELQVTPSVILNPLPGDLARAEFDFMNCEAAMLKVCKLDINWTQKIGAAK